jgi:hypothetical protein
MNDRLYPYVGPDHIRLRAAGMPEGLRIEAPDDLSRWVIENRAAAIAGGLIPATFVIGPDGQLRLADRRSEHLACSGGRPVRSAGEMFFAMRRDGVEVEEVSNLSTGYCPEPESWEAVRAALDRLGVAHPGRFTTEHIYRLCPGCGERNLVKDAVFERLVCGGELPLCWNFT